MLFYYESDYLSVNHFLSALRVGKTTFMADMKKLEKELSLSMITMGIRGRTAMG